MMNNSKIYIEHFKALEKSLNGKSENGIHKLRKKAIQKFKEIGFPTTRDEEWKYTNITPLLNHNFKRPDNVTTNVSKEDLKKILINRKDTNRIVFINGFYSPELSEIVTISKNIRIENLASVLNKESDSVLKYIGKYANKENGFIALNTALMQDGYVIIFPDNISHKEVIHIINIATGNSSVFIQARNLIVIGKNSQLGILETYHSLDNLAHFTNSVTEIIARENSTLELIRIQNENESSFHINTTAIRQESKNCLNSITITLGGKIVRNDFNPVLDGEGIESNLSGLYITDNDQLIDNHTIIDHTKPHCNSNELYKGVLKGKSRAVFNGKVFVRKNAQKTNAYQSNKNILLSKDASVDTKPQLEIFADDVKCSHGATVGQIDEQSIFYLRSRGLNENLARKILTEAFVNDVTEQVHDLHIREYINSLIKKKLTY